MVRACLHPRPRACVWRSSSSWSMALLPPVMLIVCTVFKSAADRDVYTDQFVLHHSGGPEAARRFAEEQGFVFLDRVSARKSAAAATDPRIRRSSATTTTCATEGFPNDLSSRILIMILSRRSPTTLRSSHSGSKRLRVASNVTSKSLRPEKVTPRGVSTIHVGLRCGTWYVVPQQHSVR